MLQYSAVSRVNCVQTKLAAAEIDESCFAELVVILAFLVMSSKPITAAVAYDC